MSWIVLVIAGLLEVVWAIGLKYTHGFTRLTPSVITIAAMIVSIVMLSWAMRTLPVGTAYAVWTGIGAVGAAITGILLLGESASLARIASLALIVAGIIGLNSVRTNAAVLPRLISSRQTLAGSLCPASAVSFPSRSLACGRGAIDSCDPAHTPAHGGTLCPAQ